MRTANSLVRHALESYKASDPTHVRITHVSPLVSCTPRLLYTNVLQQLKSDAEACSDASSFLKAARVLAKPISKWVIAVYDSERIRDIWPEHIRDVASSCRDDGLSGQGHGRVCVAVIMGIIPKHEWADYVNKSFVHQDSAPPTR